MTRPELIQPACCKLPRMCGKEVANSLRWYVVGRARALRASGPSNQARRLSSLRESRALAKANLAAPVDRHFRSRSRLRETVRLAASRSSSCSVLKLLDETARAARD